MGVAQIAVMGRAGAAAAFVRGEGNAGHEPLSPGAGLALLPPVSRLGRPAGKDIKVLIFGDTRDAMGVAEVAVSAIVIFNGFTLVMAWRPPPRRAREMPPANQS